MRKNADIIIAVDPDVAKNGIATLDTATRAIKADTATLPVMLHYIQLTAQQANESGRTVKVYVEDGSLNRSNWHLNPRDSKAMAAAKGKAQGMNHQRGKDIIELLQWHGIPTEGIAPLRKIWRGRERKITHKELTAIVGNVAHTNQEGRDAALIAWVMAGFPIRISG